MQYKCWKHNLILIFITFVLMTLISVLSIFISKECGERQGWNDGYSLGWFDHLKKDENYANIACSSYWWIQNQIMIEDRERRKRERDNGLCKIF